MNPIQSFFAKYDARPILGEKRDENGKLVPILGEPFFPKQVESADLLGTDAPLPTELGLSKLTASLAAFGRKLSEDYVRAFRKCALLMCMAAECRKETPNFTVGQVAAELKRRGDSA